MYRIFQMLQTFVESVFNLLGRSSLQRLGVECVSSGVWMLFCLILRILLYTAGIESIISYGLIFSLPYFIQRLGNSFSTLLTTPPLLPMRIAEGFMGRLKPMHLIITIPAHFLGCIIATIIVSALCPVSLSGALLPLGINSDVYSSSILWRLSNASADIIFAFAYSFISIVLPELLHVNNLNQGYLSFAIIPFFLIFPKSTGHPCAEYALWFVREEMHVLPEKILSPFVGAIVASIVLNIFTPDSPNQWKRHTRKL